MAKPEIGGQRKKNQCTIGYSCGTTCIDPDFKCEKEVQSEGGKRVARNMTAMAKQISGKAGGRGGGASEGASAQLAKLREIEKTIRKQKYESGVVVDSDGKELWRNDQKGNKKAVSVAGVEKIPIDQRRQSIFTHNHPNRKKGSDGGSFSGADIMVVHALGLKGVRAASGKHDHEIIIKGQTTMEQAQKMKDRYNQMKNELELSKKDQIKARGKEIYRKMRAENEDVTAEEISTAISKDYMDQVIEGLHEVNVKMAEEFGYEYRRTEI